MSFVWSFYFMKIIKKINNNFALAQDDNGRMLVAYGKGVGFPQMPYELNDLSKIDRTFYDVQKEHLPMIAEADEKVVAIAMKIVDYARLHVRKDISDSLYYILIDHINFAIERFRNNVYVPMALSKEIKFTYAEEFAAGDWAWRYINQEFKIHLPKDERSILAMHIVESEETSRRSQREITIEEITEKVLDIVSQDLDIEIDRDGFNCYRFETHLKYLLQRIDDSVINSENIAMFEVVAEKYPQIYLCAKHISDYLSRELGRNISKEELLYLMLHINRLSDRR